MDQITNVMYLEVLKQAVNLFIENDYPVPQVLLNELNECLEMKRDTLDASIVQASGNIETAGIIKAIEWLKKNTYYIPKDVDTKFLLDRISE